MRHKILVVSHCFFNDAAKLRNQTASEQERERKEKRDFIADMLKDGVEFIQLPCPEFLMYGSNRWGHASSQFDTPFFRREVRNMLEPILLQLKEYEAYPDRFEILGIVGIDGSPSCGVNFTCDGDWGGEFSGNIDLKATLGSLKQISKRGILFDELEKMLQEQHIDIRLYSLRDFRYRPKPTKETGPSLL